MKLLYSATSPFVRKVWVTALELGLAASIERIPTNPLKREDVESSPNPLGKVPCLETDDGETLYDSTVICEYLDTLAGGGRLIPPVGPARWTALRREALGNGILEAGVLRVVEGMRKEERRSQGWIAHQAAAIHRALDALEGEADRLSPSLGRSVTIGEITIGIALAFLDFRFPAENWRDCRPKLADWFESVKTRRSMQETDWVKA